MLSTDVGSAVFPATSSCIECTTPAALISEAEDDVAVMSKVIRDVWVYNKGSVDTERICRCPSTGRLQVFNRLVEEWTPLTDSDRLVADVSKLLEILQHSTHVDKCAGKLAPFCSSEQMRSLKKCSRAVDIHDSNFDPYKAKVLTMQLAKCLPNLPPGQKNYGVILWMFTPTKQPKPFYKLINARCQVGEPCTEARALQVRCVF